MQKASVLAREIVVELEGAKERCVERCISGECWFPKVQLWACGDPSVDGTDPTHGGKGNQVWTVQEVGGGGGVRLMNPAPPPADLSHSILISMIETITWDAQKILEEPVQFSWCRRTVPRPPSLGTEDGCRPF